MTQYGGGETSRHRRGMLVPQIITEEARGLLPGTKKLAPVFSIISKVCP
jgi:hypothetical protein